MRRDWVRGWRMWHMHVMNPGVVHKMSSNTKFLCTGGTFVRFLSCMNVHMITEFSFVSKGHWTHLAVQYIRGWLVCLFVIVLVHMLLESGSLSKGLEAEITSVHNTCWTICCPWWKRKYELLKRSILSILLWKYIGNSR